MNKDKKFIAKKNLSLNIQIKKYIPSTKLATQRSPLSCRNESAREFRRHDYFTLFRTTLNPIKGTTLRWLLAPEFSPRFKLIGIV